MAITIYRHGHGLDQVAISPPHGRGTGWRSSEPMTVDAIVDKLIDLGCHTTDIGDAFYAADPFWTEHEGTGKVAD